MTQPFEIIYDSDIIIRSETHLGCLCIFYEGVNLPWCPANAFGNMLGVRKSTLVDGDSHFELRQIDMPEDKRFFNDWERKMKPLFDEGVLKRLPIPPEVQLEGPNELGEMLESIYPNLSLSLPNGRAYLRVYYSVRVFHHLRSDLKRPRLFDVSEIQNPRELYKALEMERVYRYILPAVKAMSPEKILEVRELVKDTREGFSMHLQALSAEIDSRVAGGENIDELRRFATDVIDTKLIPDYREFCRQLLAKRSGLTFRVLEAARQSFSVEAPISSPRFYAECGKALGIIGGGLSDAARNGLSNRSQALHFMRAMESGSYE